MSRAWGNNTERVLALLAEAGPLTESQLGVALELPQNRMSATLQRLTSASPRMPKRVRICAWRSGEAGRKRHLRPVYALGCQADEPRPPAITPYTPRPERHRMRAARVAEAAIR